MSENILVVNAGSSSIKFQVFEVAGDSLDRWLKGQFEGIGSHPHLIAKDAEGNVVVDRNYPIEDAEDVTAAIEILRIWLREYLADDLPFAVGHRVVHGGPDFDGPVIVDRDVLEAMEKYASLAPLHQPSNLLPIKLIMQNQPQMVQVACFDTAFHRTHGETADRFAIPDMYYQEGVRRYGFHGLSYEYISRSLPEQAPDIAAGNVIVAHLGSGASVCALNDGKSVDTSMGFTALDGLIMGSRPGRLDAGVILYLLSEKKMPANAIQHMLYHDCGLKGLSGISNDVRDLVASTEHRAHLALDCFAVQAAKEIAGLTSVLGGLDGLIFTAGIGENAPEVRENICARLSWMGLEIDPAANASNAPVISTPDSSTAIRIMATDEELMIAHHTLTLCRAQGKGRTAANERNS